MRRSLERRSARDGRQPGSAEDVVVSALDLTRELEEFIAALDRRLPRVERVSEAAIARDAAALRAKALDRLAELARNPPAAPADRGRP